MLAHNKTHAKAVSNDMAICFRYAICSVSFCRTFLDFPFFMWSSTINFRVSGSPTDLSTRKQDVFITDDDEENAKQHG